MRTQCVSVKWKSALSALYVHKQGVKQMSPKQFRKWRKSLNLGQKEAASLLGLNKRMIQYYEKGERDGKAVKVPKYIRLACYALRQHIVDFDGETTTSARVDK